MSSVLPPVGISALGLFRRLSKQSKVILKCLDVAFFVRVELQLFVIRNFEDCSIKLRSDSFDQFLASRRSAIIVVIEIQVAVEPEKLQLVAGQLFDDSLAEAFNSLNI